MIDKYNLISQLIKRDPFFKNKNFVEFIKQYGGGETDKAYSFIYKGEEFIFEKYGYLIMLKGYYNTGMETDCIIIGIDEEKKIASINNISADDGLICFKQTTHKKGTFLLELAIKFVKQLIKNNNINSNIIILEDNSMLICKKNNVPLSDLKMIISGETFYSKHGFIPRNTKDVITFNKNKNVLSKMKIKDFDFLKYLLKFNNNKKYSSMINFININKENKIGSFFEKYSQKQYFKDTCIIIHYLLEKILKKNNLKSLHSIKMELSLLRSPSNT